MCIFCKIVADEIPAFKIYEDEECLAFLDLNQAARGYTLVIPKKHADHLLALPDTTAAALQKAIQNVCALLTAKLGAEGFHIINNIHPVAGQTVTHCHWHVIPRYANDDFKLNCSTAFPDKAVLAELQEKILA